MDRLKCIQIFVSVVEAGSFAAVADPYRMSAAMVGRHVRALEDQLGAQLLNRTTRRHSLTEVGRIYYQRSKSILADLDSADESVAQMRSIPRGVLKVGAPVIFGSSYLAPVLPQYLAANPDVRVELTLNNRVMDLLEEGYDLVFRTGALPDSGLIARGLAPYKLAVCASPDYLARHGMPDHPDDLANHACLGFRPGAVKENWVFQKDDADADTVSVSVSGPLSVNDSYALRAAALGGIGIALQAEALFQDDINAGRLVRVLEDYTPQALPMHMLYSPARLITPKLRSFVDFSAAHFG